jgi:hypothetical protein
VDADTNARLIGLDGSDFVVIGAKPDANALHIAGGLDIEAAPGVSLGLRGAGDISANDHQLSGSASLNIRF